MPDPDDPGGGGPQSLGFAESVTQVGTGEGLSAFMIPTSDRTAVVLGMPKLDDNGTFAHVGVAGLFDN
jgi:hypothetical protein